MVNYGQIMSQFLILMEIKPISKQNADHLSHTLLIGNFTQSLSHVTGYYFGIGCENEISFL